MSCHSHPLEKPIPKATPPIPIKETSRVPIKVPPPIPIEATPPIPVQETPYARPPAPIEETPYAHARPSIPVKETPRFPTKVSPPIPIEATPPFPIQETPYARPSVPIKETPYPGPSIPIKETPRVPIKETPYPWPSVPIKETPPILIKEKPRVPVKGTPRVPIKETPPTPIRPETPPIPTKETPSIPIKETPSIPIEETPTKETPSIPTKETPSIPTKETPPIPIEATPPPPLIVNEMLATPSFAVSTTDPNEILTVPGFVTQVFDLQSPTKYVDTSDPTKASTRPIAFAYPVIASTPKTFAIALKLTLNFTAPPEWSAVPTSKCVVFGSLLSDPLKPIFQSDAVPVGNVKDTWTVNSLNVEFPQVMLSGGGKLPFKWAGTFVWMVKVVDNPLLVSLPTVIPTVLEFYFTNLPAPEGHRGTFGNPILEKVPEFKQIYPVTLLRQFWPVATDIPSGDPLRQEKLNQFYCQNVIKTLWALGKPQFDSTKGQSSYGVGALGGTFDLAAWASLKYPLCNTFDLCAVLHLACSLALDTYGGAELQPIWVLNDGVEFITPGQLYGLTDASANPCNNPFWQTFLDRPASTPMIDAASKSRTCFFRHAWLEVSMYDPTPGGLGPYQGVLDASFLPSGETAAQVDSGSRDRGTYLLNRLDKTRPENGITETSPGVYTVTTDGDRFYTTDDRGYMVGVVSTNLTYPIAPFLQGDDSTVGIQNAYMPVGLKNDINALLKLGDSGARESRTIIVDAPLDADSLTGALKPLDATISVTSLSRSVFHTINTFSNNFKTASGEFDAEFESYQNYITAKARLVHYLTTFSIGPLASYVKASPKLDQAVGHICLWVGSDVVVVYGNLFVKITLKSLASPTPDLWKIFAGLFKFIKTNTTGKTQSFNPLEDLGPADTVAAKSGTTVKIALKKADSEVVGTMALIRGGDTDTGTAYTWQMKAGDTSGTFTFRVAGLGEQKVILTVGNANKGLVRSVAYTVSISSS
ncbi:hypothetical protein TWF481_012071 [Arthrobotrys musiformis]|uniref:Uncharacterized protein n=1 Tax=Arthrobotrys musiformis TaxID=47236 RepID=A0AAV9VYU2_9PEZI